MNGSRHQDWLCNRRADQAPRNEVVDCGQSTLCFRPTHHLRLDQAVVDGEAVIVGTVDELDPSQKPCRVSGGQNRGVWIRAWEGEYERIPSLTGTPRSRGPPLHNSTSPQPDPGAVRCPSERAANDTSVGFQAIRRANSLNHR